MHIENDEKEIPNFFPMSAKNDFAGRRGGGTESCGHVRNYNVFYAFPYWESSIYVKWGKAYKKNPISYYFGYGPLGYPLKTWTFFPIFSVLFLHENYTFWTILYLLVCISKNHNVFLFFQNSAKNRKIREGGGSERYGLVRNLYFFLRLP